MAENAEVRANDTKKPRTLGLVVWLVLSVVSVGSGLATPYLINQLTDGQEASPRISNRDPGEPPSIIEFGEVVVNLNESRLNRYLRVKISVLVAKSQQAEISELIDKNSALLKSWLLSYLADKGMEDIRGATGQNRLRREIQRQFNSVLFPDGAERIQNILFEEFNIQ